MIRPILGAVAAAAMLGLAAPLLAQDNAHEAATTPMAAPSAPTPAPNGGPPEPIGAPVPVGYAPFPVDSARVERGRRLFATNCASCHAMDIRGGDRGPNLRRSRFVLNDTGNGKLVGLEVRESLGHGEVFLHLRDEEAADLTHFLQSFPPMKQGGAEISVPTRFELGDPAAGQRYFAGACATCHAVTPGAASPAANLAGIGRRIADPMTLQQAWLSPKTRQPTVARVTLKDGSVVEGPAVEATEFIVALRLDGAIRRIARSDATRVEMSYPLLGHARLLPTISDTNIHDVTGYLASLR